jgi:dTDP-4-amino-4,6-dideoxygalactose transaminase
MGDAGAVVTADAEIAAAVRALREHGQREKYRHVLEGYTARLDTLQAIVLLRKLPELDGWNEQRRAVAAAYTRHLAGVGDLVLPPTAPESEPVWHLYVVRTADPAALAAHLASRGVGTGRHYPEPIHLSEAYRSLGYSAGDFPVTERLAATVLSLPMFPGMTSTETETVVDAVKEYFDR